MVDGIHAAWLSGKTMIAVLAHVAGGHEYMTFETVVGTDYVVTAAKTFKILKVIYEVGASAVEISLGYGDDGVASGGAAPTNFVGLPFEVHAVASLTAIDKEIYVEVPAGKYPCFKTENTATEKYCMIIGVEE